MPNTANSITVNNVKFQKKPFEVIDVQSISSSGNSRSSLDECAICLDTLPRNDLENITYRLKCGHVYHSECILEWFKKYYTCPYCRSFELDINCYWLWLKPYYLSCLNKFCKYKFAINENNITVTRKKQKHVFYFKKIKYISCCGQVVHFKLSNDKIVSFHIYEAMNVFKTLERMLNTGIANANVDGANDHAAF